MSISYPPLSLGANVFGWTADEAESFAVLDAAREAGIHFLDSADVYAAWVNGGVGGQSETIIGKWLAARPGAREETIVATKGGSLPSLPGLSAANLTKALDGSLERLGVDVIDLYYAHHDRGEDLVEALGAFDGFIKAGKIREYGLSNFAPERLREALAVAEQEGFAKPTAFQPEYSLMARAFEDELQEICADADLAVVPYYALASGFLTGKYRPGVEVDSARASKGADYLAQPSALPVLAALDAAAEAHGVPVASVAIAWLRQQPTVVAPIASARTVEQVAPLAASLKLELTPDELQALTVASAVGAPAAG